MYSTVQVGQALQTPQGSGRQRPSFSVPRLRRTLDLIKGDLAAATAVSETPGQEQPACNLAGRTPVLHLITEAGPITCALGPAPSAIWRRQMLMRCGPAFGLDGALRPDMQPMNRVVLDGLPAAAPSWESCGAPAEALPLRPLGASSALPFSICVDPTGSWAAMRLVHQLRPGARITTTMSAELALRV